MTASDQRIEFAKAALIGLLAFSPNNEGHSMQFEPQQVAEMAFQYADAMMEEMKFKPQPKTTHANIQNR